ncbi:unnamed protein product [Cylindrotheca closterium]|uniref:Uncharacterized protein n=1 Tax=Cylindrotheca closterium TaxID=2856 RepID=A0AAD2CAF1_9STRA|nr:unnamed protein product [Cylindrotheca closterium]
MNAIKGKHRPKKEGKPAYDRTPLISDEARRKSASSVDDEERGTYGILLTPLVKPTNLKQRNVHANQNVDLQGNEGTKEDSYIALLNRNRNLRFYIFSLLVTNCGEWLSYIASIDLIETRLARLNQESRTAVSILVLVRLLPNVIFSSVGGKLADKYDRRQLMFGLDVISAVVTLLFVVAYELQSIPIVYVASFAQQALAGLYQPSSYSIIPMLVNDDDNDLKKATTMQGMVWSAMQAFGAALSGFVVDALGVRICFYLDAGTFVLSALFMWMVRGEYRAVPVRGEYKTNPKKKAGAIVHPVQPDLVHSASYVDGVKYLFSSYFAALIFVKGIGELASGACDVLNVVVSEQDDDTGGLSSGFSSNFKLGVLFFFVGTGCMIGPLVSQPFVDAERPSTLQLSCALSFAIATIGYVGWCWGPPSFWVLCFFALLRSAGSSVTWINSSILLQKFASTEMMGRVMSMDYAVALAGEALSAYLCGFLMDRYGLSFHEVVFGLTMISLISTAFWFIYHFSGRGAVKYRVRPSMISLVPVPKKATRSSNS